MTNNKKYTVNLVFSTSTNRWCERLPKVVANPFEDGYSQVSVVFGRLHRNHVKTASPFSAEVGEAQ